MEHDEELRQDAVGMEHEELPEPVDLPAELDTQGVIVLRRSRAGNRGELALVEVGKDGSRAVEGGLPVLGVHGAPERRAAGEGVEAPPWVLAAAAVEPGVQLLERTRGCESRVDCNVLVDFLHLLGQVCAMPEQATAEFLIQAVRQDREHRLRLGAVQQQLLIDVCVELEVRGGGVERRGGSGAL